MNTYHVLEVATETGYFVFVEQDEKTFDAKLGKLTKVFPDSEVESYAIGTVNASSEEKAINKIRSGKWEYTQKL